MIPDEYIMTLPWIC